VTVTKSASDFLMVVAMYDKSDRTTSSDVGDFWSATSMTRSAA
jgi:multidrug efflux pump